MATSTVAGPRRTGLLALALAGALSAVPASAQQATIFPMPKVLEWQKDSMMHMEITTLGSSMDPLEYAVIPMTASLGLNNSDVARGAINFHGSVVAVDTSNFVTVADAANNGTIIYLSCDASNDSYISQDTVLDRLMEAKPRAILLYTQEGSCCGLSGSNLPYSSILSMADKDDALSTLNLTHTAHSSVLATITGNATSNDPDGDGGGGGGAGPQPTGSNSAVAMSILYSITGLITLLFLVIIATGAIRAHRYPERYGPRGAHGGRPRQSRARGLARAVLETIPIVKFGNPEPAKPDPSSYELESASVDQQQVDRTGDHPSAGPEGPPDPPQQAAGGDNSSQRAVETSAAAGTNAADEQGDEHLGCSICTEDFHVGEDVRVLPCNHKFHPQCVDPWLVNVSGTCPLCRLDLRPEEDKNPDPTAEEGAQLAPPLGGEGAAAEGSSSQRRRSRLFDLHRLRHAPVEERIEALRRYRTEQQADRAGAAEPEERSHRAGLSDRLRDRFHIRTRAQSPEGPPRGGGAPPS